MREIILVTGGSGLVGKAIQQIKANYSYTWHFVTSKDCDLTDLENTKKLFDKIKPNFVIHLAANVGGLYKNMNNKVSMLEDNLQINFNVLKCCDLFGVEKCISCLSTCIFPDKVEYPITEEQLHDGPPHYSNNTYAYSKRLLEIQSNAYKEQYKKQFICVIPTNIYGPDDNFSLENGHVIPALIHKCYIAKKNNNKFTVKGSGKPLRQFIYSLDLAELIMWVLEKYTLLDNIILSVSEQSEVSIKHVAEQIAKAFDYNTSLEFDTSFEDGQYKKTVDNSKLVSLYSNYTFTNIETGIRNTVDWFRANYDSCRK